MVNVGSLFSGIGGLDLGLARAGFRHAFFCESDAWRRTVLAQHWPGVPIYEDVCDIRLAEGNSGGVGQAGHDEPVLGGVVAVERDPRSGAVDLLCGGFPCQDVSVAGRRAGLAGERSGLFYEFARIAESLRPRWILVENVPGLLSSNGGRDFGAVIGTLADIGYGVAWRILDSRYFGVPQRRRRVFVLGALAGGDPRGAAERAGEVLAVGTRCERHPATRGEAGQDVAGTLGGGAGERGWAQDTERMTFLPVAHLLMSHGGNDKHDPTMQTYVVAPLSHGSNPNSNMAGRRREDDENLVAVHMLQDPISDANVTPAWGKGTKAGSASIAVSNGSGVRRLTPTECSRLQSLPDHWLDLASVYVSTPEAHATQVLRSLWLEAGTPHFEERTPGSVAALLTPEVLLAGVYGGWVSWEMAIRRAEARGQVQGSNAWPEGFVRGLREAARLRSTPHRRESFEQLARELGRSLSELPLEEAQAVALVLGSRLWPEASQERPLRYARPEGEAGSSAGSARASSSRSGVNPSPDSRRYAALGDAVTASVSEWIGRRLVAA